MRRVLILGAERDLNVVKKYAECSDEVYAICYGVNIGMDRLTSEFDNLLQICVLKKLDNITDSLRYLAETARIPYKIDDFSAIIYLRQENMEKCS